MVTYSKTHTARVLLGDRELDEALPVQHACVEARKSPEFQEKLASLDLFL